MLFSLVLFYFAVLKSIHSVAINSCKESSSFIRRNSSSSGSSSSCCSCSSNGSSSSISSSSSSSSVVIAVVVVVVVSVPIHTSTQQHKYIVERKVGVTPTH